MIKDLAVHLLNKYSDKLSATDMKDILLTVQALLKEEQNDKHTEVSE